MKNFIFGMLLGVITGGAGVYLYDKRKYTREFNEALEERVNEEVDKYREYIEEREEERMEAEMRHVKKGIKDKPTVKQVEENQVNEILKDYRTADDYARDEEQSSDEELEELIEATENEEKIREALKQAHLKPKVLEKEHFGEISMYECETLRFYVQDKFLVHEDNTVVEDVEELVGDALDRYGWADDDTNEESLYVRNYEYERDYEIEKVFDEWHGAD